MDHGITCNWRGRKSLPGRGEEPARHNKELEFHPQPNGMEVRPLWKNVLSSAPGDKGSVSWLCEEQTVANNSGHKEDREEKLAVV